MDFVEAQKNSKAENCSKAAMKPRRPYIMEEWRGIVFQERHKKIETAIRRTLRLCRKITFLIHIGFTVQNALKTEKLFFGRDLVEQPHDAPLFCPNGEIL